VGRPELLAAESQAYHGPGTCTFYGTANSNQMLMEVMGLHLPGASFVNPNTPLRGALTDAAARRITEITALGREYTPVGRLVDERAIVNAMVGLLATGGSTNHTIHLVAIAHAAGLRIDWDDFSDLSDVVPLLTRIYPNGNADVNAFQAAGGMALLIGELLDAGLLHADVLTVRGGGGLQPYRKRPGLSEESVLAWQEEPQQSLDPKVLTSTSSPFSADGGIKVLAGNLGRAIVKTSCLKDEWRVVEAPALIFDDQKDLQAAFRRGELYRDFVAVVRFQGPRANGMPELHELTPSMCVVQDRGFKVGLVTDGRMSGASGKVPAAIHVTPECAAGGPLARVRNGDMIRLDSLRGVLEALVDPAEWERREAEVVELTRNACGTGRELFDVFRANVTSAESGAISVGLGLKEIGQIATDCAIQVAIEQERGNLHRAATRLDVTDRALQLRRAQQRQST
jgi:phosphogluconate dehydratase